MICSHLRILAIIDKLFLNRQKIDIKRLNEKPIKCVGANQIDYFDNHPQIFILAPRLAIFKPNQSEELL